LSIKFNDKTVIYTFTSVNNQPIIGLNLDVNRFSIAHANRKRNSCASTNEKRKLFQFVSHLHNNFIPFGEKSSEKTSAQTTNKPAKSQTPQ
jgi:hypothetical protein